MYYETISFASVYQYTGFETNTVAQMLAKRENIQLFSISLFNQVRLVEVENSFARVSWVRPETCI